MMAERTVRGRYRMLRTLGFLLTAWTASLLFGAASAAIVRAPGENVLTIGIVDTFSPDFYVGTYAPTVDHLMESLPDRDFRFVEIDFREVARGIARERPDFIVTAGSTYVNLIGTSGAHQVATRMTDASASVSESLASVFVVRGDGPIRSFGDLRGKRAAVTDRRSFEGWLIAQGEIARRGLDPDTVFSEVIETKYGIPDPTTLVKTGVADVGILSACEFETLAAGGFLKTEDFRILGERSDGGSRGGCRRSTERYPDAVFASLPWADADDVAAVTVALLSFRAPEEAFRWTVCNDFLATRELLRTLRTGPYAYLRDMSPEGLARRFRTELLLLGVLAAALLVHLVTVNVLVRRRTRELTEALAEVTRAHEEAERTRTRLGQFERAGVVAHLSSLFAHEIKQPLMNLSLYAGALRMMLRKSGVAPEGSGEVFDAMEAEIARSSEIVEHVRAYAKKRRRRPERFLLADAVRTAAKSFPGERIVGLEVLPAATWVSADRFEVEFVVTNFLKNALDAAKRSDTRAAVSVGIGGEGDVWRVWVADEGPKLSDEAFARLGKLTVSDKEEGLGFGLAIAAGVAEANGGHLEFERLEPRGLRASLLLKKA